VNTQISPILNEYGENIIKSVIPNLDPYFFVPAIAGTNITSENISEQPYKFHPWVYRCVNVIMINLARLKKIIVTIDGSETIKDHEALNVLRNPNELLSENDLWQSIICALLLPCGVSTGSTVKGGTCFLIADSGKEYDGGRVNLRKGEIPEYFYPYDESAVTPVTEVKGGIKRLVAWSLKTNASKGKLYKPENLIRIRMYNPYDWLSGIAQFTPAQLAMSQDIRADVYNTKFFDNNAVPAGILKAKQNVTTEQLKMAVKMFYQNYGGAGNVNRVAALPMDMDYQHIGFTHQDMQWKDQKDYNRNEIISVYGLNKIAVGDYENINYATINAGRKMLWTDTYIPLNEIIWSAINTQWISNIPGVSVLGTSDYSTVEALQDDYESKSRIAAVMVKDLGFPPVMAAKIAKIPISNEDIEKYPWLSEKQTYGPSINIPDFDESYSDKNGGNDNDESKKYIKKAIELPSLINKIEVGSDEWTNISRDYIAKALEPGEAEFIYFVNKFFVSQRNMLQDKVDEWLEMQKTSKTILVKDLSIITFEEFLFDKTIETEKIVKALTPAYKQQIKRASIRVGNEIGELINWNLKSKDIDRFIEKRIKDLKEINNTTFEAVKSSVSDTITDAIKNNWTPQQIAKEIKTNIFDNFETRKNQSMTIARTETGIVSSDVRYDAFKAEGIEYHQWLNAADERVRSSHIENTSGGEGGNVIKVGDRFPVTGLMHPNDTSTGNLAEFINCRCVAIAYKGD